MCGGGGRRNPVYGKKKCFLPTGNLESRTERSAGLHLNYELPGLPSYKYYKQCMSYIVATLFESDPSSWIEKAHLMTCLALGI